MSRPNSIYPPEFREPAARMVTGIIADHGSQWAAMQVVVQKFGGLVGHRHQPLALKDDLTEPLKQMKARLLVCSSAGTSSSTARRRESGAGADCGRAVAQVAALRPALGPIACLAARRRRG